MAHHKVYHLQNLKLITINFPYNTPTIIIITIIGSYIERV